MRRHFVARFFFAALTFVMPYSHSCGERFGLAKPTPEQVAWHEMEIEMFVCLDPCTWQNREYDNHSTPLSQINPEKLDTDQWCRVAMSFGARQVLFVAKHTGGFCWWQTETSEYSIKNTPWRGGRGDVLRELSESCRKFGLKLAIYVYPGDDTWGAPVGSGGKTRDPAKQEGYNKVFRQQMREVLSKYGPISEVWFDGSCVIEVGDILKKYAPKAMVFQGPHATLRWPGNERGIAPYPTWNAVKSVDAASGVSTGRHSDPDGEVWLPMEMDTTLLDHKWFWGEKTDHMLKSLDTLMDIYYKSVGRGCVLLLNSTPDTTGLIPESHVKLYTRFGAEIEKRFGKSIAETEGKGEIVTLAFDEPTIVNHVISMEDIRYGQRVRGYVIEGMVDGQWRKLQDGVSIGYKKIDLFEHTKATKVRLRITESVGEPIIARLAAFNVNASIPVHIESAKASSEHESGNYGACMMIDGRGDTRWGGSNAGGTSKAWVEFDLGEVKNFDRIVIREGWGRIRRFSLQNKGVGGWQTFYSGLTVGNMDITVDPVRTRYVRWLINETTDLPTVWEFELYSTQGHILEESRSASWQKAGGWDNSTVAASWTTLDIDLTRHVRMAGQYEVRFCKTDGAGDIEIKSVTAVLEGMEAAGFATRLGKTRVFNLNRTAAVQDQEGTTGIRIVMRTVGNCAGEILIRPAEE